MFLIGKYLLQWRPNKLLSNTNLPIEPLETRKLLLRFLALPKAWSPTKNILVIIELCFWLQCAWSELPITKGETVQILQAFLAWQGQKVDLNLWLLILRGAPLRTAFKQDRSNTYGAIGGVWCFKRAKFTMRWYICFFRISTNTVLFKIRSNLAKNG